MANTLEKQTKDRLANWWRGLQKPHNSGSRAELRRAATVDAVIMTPAFQRLCSGFTDEFRSDFDKTRLAAIAGLLAHVKESAEPKMEIAKQMAQPAGAATRVSELRFRRLLQRNRSDLFVPMVRVIRLLDHRVSIYDLIESVYYWGDQRKKKWAYAYFS